MSKENKVQSQSISFITVFVLITAARAILGYIAVYFFRPVWERLMGSGKKSG